jgi:hypothetical protein
MKAGVRLVGARLVMQQRAIVALDRRGYDIVDAVEHLELLEGMQAEYVDHLEAWNGK